MTIDPMWLKQQFPSLSQFAALQRGGQRWVYSANHNTEGAVVLKLFHPGADVARLLREIEAVQRIASNHIPQIREAGRIASPLGTLLWVREEFVPGTNGRALLAIGPLPDQAILRLGLHLLEALAAAEAVRIVHRDVKPDNLIVGVNGKNWLLDFGYARLLDLVSLTATAERYGCGTAGYAAPEQSRNRKIEIDGRADLFALGVTMYEFVEGVNPNVQGIADPLERLRRTESQPLPAIRRSISSSGEFRDLVYTMTRIRRDHRPHNVAEALYWMQEICAAEGIS